MLTSGVLRVLQLEAHLRIEHVRQPTQPVSAPRIRTPDQTAAIHLADATHGVRLIPPAMLCSSRGGVSARQTRYTRTRIAPLRGRPDRFESHEFGHFVAMWRVWLKLEVSLSLGVGGQVMKQLYLASAVSDEREERRTLGSNVSSMSCACSSCCSTVFVGE